MDILQLNLYRDLAHRTTLNGSNGAELVTDAFTKICLEHASIDQVHIFTSDIANKNTFEWTLANTLSAEIAGKAAMCYPDGLTALLASPRSIVALGTFPQASDLLAILGAATANRVPLCSLVHAVPVPRLLDRLTSYALYSEASDALVVSSSAGRGAVINLLDQLANLLQARGYSIPLERLKSQVHKVPLGIETSRFRLYSREQARQILCLSESNIYFLYVGRLTSHLKGDLEPLIRAVAELAVERPLVRLIIAGFEEEAGYADRLRVLAAHCNSSDLIDIKTNISELTKEVLLASADVFVSPSDTIQETFGIAILEAMSAGLPVITPNWSGYRDLVRDKHTGILLDTWIAMGSNTSLNVSGASDSSYDVSRLLSAYTVFDVQQLCDAMKDLVDNPYARLNMGAAGRSVAQEYRWSYIIDLFIELWTEQLRRAQSDAGVVRPYLDFLAAFRLYPQANKTLDGLELQVPARERRPSSESGEEIDSRKENPYYVAQQGLEGAQSLLHLDLSGNADPALTAVTLSLLKRGVLRIAR